MACLQLLGVVAIAAWTIGNNLVLFWILRRVGWLRVSREVEEEGLDFSQSVGTGELACTQPPCLK